jgi:hypothetical protein
MPKWEIRRVSGYGFLKDTAVAAYKDINEESQKYLRDNGVKHIGKLEEFISPEHLFEKYRHFDDVPENEIAALRTTWQGIPLPAGTAYCVVTDFDADPAVAAEQFKKVVQTIGDRVVAAKQDTMFGNKALSEAHKNVAQAEKTDGGVWGVKRKPGRP